MRSLLKADFKRVLQDKLLIVMGILAVVFAAMTPLLYALMFIDIGIEEDPMVASLISGKAQFFSSFSIGNNLGMIAPVLLAIALCKDFSFGTVRNKIIAGKSRSGIFLSLFVTCATVLIAVMLLHAFITLGISLIFFDYQPTAFVIADLWYFLESLAFEFLVLLWVAALLSYLCACAKNVGLVIVLYIAVTFLLVIVASIVQGMIAVMGMIGDNEQTLEVLRFIDRINIGSATVYIGTGTAYTLEDVLYLTVPPTVGILGFLGLGLWRFNKKDLK